MLTGLRHAHEGLAYLFVFSTLLSMGLAWAALFVGAKPMLLKVGAVLARIVETSIGGLMGLMGIAMWYLSHLPLSTPYLWMGLAVVIASGGLIARGIKPTLLGLASQDDKAGRLRWVQFATLHFGLVAFAMAAMEMRLGT
jgi:hypothetical protein